MKNVAVHMRSEKFQQDFPEGGSLRKLRVHTVGISTLEGHLEVLELILYLHREIEDFN